jgi:ATP-binding cassette subfamily B protein
LAEVKLPRAIDELVASKTVVVIARRMRTVRRAHRILVLAGGRIVESGTHDQLRARDGRYAAMWCEQCRARDWRLAS